LAVRTLVAAFALSLFLSTAPTLICSSLLLSNEAMRRNLLVAAVGRELRSKALEVFDRTDSELAELG
jgi:hypothetical protein